MIVCSINGQQAYPLTSDKIKVTVENPFIKDSGEYTYEISFPMTLAENRRIFSNVQRQEVSKKRIKTFDDCKLYANNSLIIAGKGTITTITNKMVKMQIVGGKSRIKYDSKWENHYIDEIDYNSFLLMDYMQFKDGIDSRTNPLTNGVWASSRDVSFVGWRGYSTFATANDETNGIRVNRRILQKGLIATTSGLAEIEGYKMDRLAVQPNLMYVLKKVLEFEGYSIARNDIDAEPWNRLYIANVYQTLKMAEALPHWTVYYFIEEIAKLFGATFLFNDVERKVEIISKNEILSAGIVNGDTEDEFTVDYNDDGMSNSSTDNLAYNLSESSERSWREDLPLTVLKNFDIKEYNNESEMNTAVASMTEKQKRTTIFLVAGTYYTYTMVTHVRVNQNGETTERESLSRVIIGAFRPLVQDNESTDATEINIVPVAMNTMKLNEEEENIVGKPGRYMPSLTNPKSEANENLTEDNDGSFYLSVADAINGVTDSRKEENKGVMNIMFMTNKETMEYPLPHAFTDWALAPTDNRVGASEFEAGVSLSLRNIHAKFNAEIDTKNTACFKFLTTGVPSARKIYNFRGKKYLPQKIEIEIKNGKLDELATGYFCEISD